MAYTSRLLRQRGAAGITPPQEPEALNPYQAALAAEDRGSFGGTGGAAPAAQGGRDETGGAAYSPEGTASGEPIMPVGKVSIHTDGIGAPYTWIPEDLGDTRGLYAGWSGTDEAGNRWYVTEDGYLASNENNEAGAVFDRVRDLNQLVQDWYDGKAGVDPAAALAAEERLRETGNLHARRYRGENYVPLNLLTVNDYREAEGLAPLSPEELDASGAKLRGMTYSEAVNAGLRDLWAPVESRGSGGGQTPGGSYGGGSYGGTYGGGAWPGAQSVPASAPSYRGNDYEVRRDALLRELEDSRFRYDPAEDPVWQAYQRQYRREGQRASEDALGRAAAMTGGVPGSWAVTAAAQAGNRYAAQLSDKLPEVYQDAYNRYLAEYERQLGLADTYNRYARQENEWQQALREYEDRLRRQSEEA